MRFFVVRKKKIVASFALFLFLISPSSRSEEFTQAGAQNTAAKLNNRGSDDSMEAATNSAMVAVMNLAALNIPGAFSNGYRAYGQYINSEKLDDLELKTTRRKGSMSSVGYGMVGGGSNSGTGGNGKNGGGISGTTFSRLDPAFLYRGETSEVAAEFEKRSGMKREDFLRHLGSATDSDITFQDPNLQQKLEGRFEMFKAGIQNKDFKDGLEKAASMFSPSMRSEAIAKLQSYYNEQWGGGSPEILAEAPAENLQAAPTTSANASPLVNAEAPNSTKNDEEKIARAPASASIQGGKNSMFIGINSGNPQDTINELLNSPQALETDSIFLKVSKKYRSLTPRMMGSAPTLPMKF
jgi:hypothetical protein